MFFFWLELKHMEWWEVRTYEKSVLKIPGECGDFVCNVVAKIQSNVNVTIWNDARLDMSFTAVEVRSLTDLL